jgi:hypothetical protein
MTMKSTEHHRRENRTIGVVSADVVLYEDDGKE